jgi:hypothetical protein
MKKVSIVDALNQAKLAKQEVQNLKLKRKNHSWLKIKEMPS